MGDYALMRDVDLSSLGSGSSAPGATPGGAGGDGGGSCGGCQRALRGDFKVYPHDGRPFCARCVSGVFARPVSVSSHESAAAALSYAVTRLRALSPPPLPPPRASPLQADHEADADLRELLLDDDALQHLLEYCVSNYTVESILFWLDVAQFSDLEAPEDAVADYAAVGEHAGFSALRQSLSG
jgi:hypothetical protein